MAILLISSSLPASLTPASECCAAVRSWEGLAPKSFVRAHLTPRYGGAFYDRAEFQAAVPATDRRPQHRRAAFPARVGREQRCRGLLPRDLHLGTARLSAAARCLEPAGVALDDRGPEGDRQPPRACEKGRSGGAPPRAGRQRRGPAGRLALGSGALPAAEAARRG